MRNLMLLMMFFLSYKGYAQNTSYRNWYYDSREKLYQALNTKKYDVIFFGNSITEHGPWQELIGAQYRIGNRGIGGDNTYGMRARIEGVVKSQPKKIFLMMGINDIGSSISIDSIINNYEAMIHIIRRKSPKTTIYLQSILPLNDSILPYDYLKNKESMIRELGGKIRQFAEANNLIYVDVRSVLAEDYLLKPEYTTDGIHLNTEAYIAWVEYLKKNKYL